MLGPADKGIATFEKAKKLIGGASNADADARADRPRGMIGVPEPERASSAEVQAIVAAVDLHRGCEAARSTGEIEKAGDFAVALHEFDALEGLKATNENRCGSAGGFAYHVQHEVRAIIEEDVDVARSEIHRADTRRGTAKMVTGGIAGRISLGFDDAAAQPAGPKVVDDHFADQEACESNGFLRQLGAAQAAGGDF